MSGTVGRPARSAGFRHVLRDPVGAICLAFLALVVVSAAVSLVWTPWDLQASNVQDRLAGPSANHLLGTDSIGRDTASWLMAGARTALIVMAGAIVIAFSVGISLGVVTASLPAKVREGAVVVTDLLVAFPVLLIAALLAAPFGGSLAVVILAVGIGQGVNLARIIRADILRIARSDYVIAAHASGVGVAQRWRQHIVPNLAPILWVQLTATAAVALLAEAGLTYLGYGPSPSIPSWGGLLREAQKNIQVAPWSVVWPGAAIALTVLAINLLGDRLRDATDPQVLAPAAAANDHKAVA